MLISLAVGWFAYEKFASKSSGATPPQGMKSMAVPVKAVKATTSELSYKLETIGTLVSEESVVIRPEIAGVLEKFGFLEGSQVKKGDIILVIDDSTFRAEFNQKKAESELAKVSYNRAKVLKESGHVSNQAYDDAYAKLKSSEAEAELAKARLDKTIIRAPFNGIIGLRRKSIGDFIAVGEETVNIEQIESLKVDFQVAERDFPSIKIGQKIELRFESFPSEVFYGEVYAINPKVDPIARNVEVRARIPNADMKLRPGMFAKIELILKEKNDALVVPEQAIVPMGGKNFIYKVIEEKAVLSPVTTGLRKEAAVEIIEGVAADDVVITDGQIKIRGNNVPVNVIEEEPKKP